MKFIGLLSIAFIVSCTSPYPKPSPAKKVAHQAIDLPKSSSSLTSTVTKTLSWDSNATEEQITNYRVYEVIAKNGTTPPYWRRIGTVDVPELTLNALIVGSLHIYSVTAVNALKESDASFKIYRVTP